MKKLLIKRPKAKFYETIKMKKGRSYLYAMYLKCNKFWLTRWYVEKISRGYEVLYPGEKIAIANKTMKTSILLWILCFGAVGVLLLNHPSFYSGANTILFIAIMHYEIVNGSTNAMEIRLLKQLEKYLSDVRHSYYVNHMVEEAIADGMESCGYEIRIHATKIYDILTGDDPEEEICKYNDTVPNKFLRLFLALSITVINYGDKDVNGQSLFLSNIKTLKNDIHIELLKLSETRFRFSGLVFIAVVPVFFLRTIEDWSVSNLPELQSYYSGPKGTFLAILIYIITIISYIMLNQLKEIRSIIPKDHYILECLTSNKWLNRILENYMEKHYGRILKVKEVLKKAGDNISVKQFTLKRIMHGTLSFFGSTLVFIYLHMHNHTGYLLWQEVIASCCFSYLAYWFPYWMILYRRKIMQLSMEDEIIQFQSVIMMLMYMDRISVLNILEFMESFAVIFKDSIQNCINDYNAGDIQALEDMREKEAFEPFKRLTDNLLVCDRIGIEKAFDEVNSDRIYYQDKRKQENEMNLSVKAVLGKLIAYVPLTLTIGLYLIVPFIMESMNQLMEYAADWNMM